MIREQQQEHAIRIVAEHLDDNIEFLTVAEDEALEDHEDAWQEIHDLCGMILDQLHHQARNAHPERFWWEEYADAE